jgi:two-component system response regulator MprA
MGIEPPNAPRVLVVEDDADVRALLVEQFTAEGWRVDEATDGDVALTRLEDHAYALVVLDFWLPRFNGAQVLAYMHALGDVPPVIVMSAIAQGAALTGACAADAFVRKPFDDDTVLTLARRLITRGPRPRANASGTYQFRLAKPTGKTGQ